VVTEHTVIVGDPWVDTLVELSGLAKSEKPLLPGTANNDDYEGDPAGTLGFTITSSEQVAKYVMYFLLQKGMKIANTEGMIDASVFPINYFSARQINYFYDDAEATIASYIKESKKV